MEKETPNKENGSSKRGDLTSAIEDGNEFDIHAVIKDKNMPQKQGYSRSDIDEFNQEIGAISDAAENLVNRAQKSEHIFFEKKKAEIPPKSVQKKPKSSLKMQYEAEVTVIKSRLGSVSTIRKNLNLNQRQASHLLMVDPSAFNRWEKAGNDAPSYIYRALEWYTLLQDKHPSMGNGFWLSQDQAQINEQKIEKIKEELKADLSSHFQQNQQSYVAPKENYKKLILFLILGLIIGKLLSI